MSSSTAALHTGQALFKTTEASPSELQVELVQPGDREITARGVTPVLNLFPEISKPAKVTSIKPADTASVTSPQGGAASELLSTNLGLNTLSGPAAGDQLALLHVSPRKALRADLESSAASSAPGVILDLSLRRPAWPKSSELGIPWTPLRGKSPSFGHRGSSSSAPSTSGGSSSNQELQVEQYVQDLTSGSKKRKRTSEEIEGESALEFKQAKSRHQKAKATLAAHEPHSWVMVLGAADRLVREGRTFEWMNAEVKAQQQAQREVYAAHKAMVLAQSKKPEDIKYLAGLKNENATTWQRFQRGEKW